MKKYVLLPHIQKLLTELSDFVFPPSEAEKLLRSVNQLTLKTLYQPGVFKNFTYLCRYGEPIVQAAILENKFYHSQLAAKHLRSILEYWVETQTKLTLYIPIPLGRKRFRQRGHNQVETFLQTVVPRSHIETKVLQRRVETLPQSQLDKNSRYRNVKNAFEFTGNKFDFSAYSQVVIVDDVLTTGATLTAARATLAPHLPPNITLTCLTLAH